MNCQALLASSRSLCKVQPFTAGHRRVRTPVVRRNVVKMQAEAPTVDLEKVKSNRNLLLKSYQQEQMKPGLPEIRIGDTVQIELVIVEKQKEERDKMGNLVKAKGSSDKVRIQKSTGTIIAKSGHYNGATFTLRRVFQGVGVELVFPVNSPQVKSLKIIKSAKVRRAKLYFLRERIGKAARLETKVRKKPQPQPQ